MHFLSWTIFILRYFKDNIFFNDRALLVTDYNITTRISNAKIVYCCSQKFANCKTIDIKEKFTEIFPINKVIVYLLLKLILIVKVFFNSIIKNGFCLIRSS